MYIQIYARPGWLGWAKREFNYLLFYLYKVISSHLPKFLDLSFFLSLASIPSWYTYFLLFLLLPPFRFFFFFPILLPPFLFLGLRKRFI
jgi:hypothetical protein